MRVRVIRITCAVVRGTCGRARPTVLNRTGVAVRSNTVRISRSLRGESIWSFGPGYERCRHSCGRGRRLIRWIVRLACRGQYQMKIQYEALERSPWDSMMFCSRDDVLFTHVPLTRALQELLVNKKSHSDTFIVSTVVPATPIHRQYQS
jgi:hypothetical protein